MYYVKILIDSDCLIKLVKASLKELVAKELVLHITPLVKTETIDAVSTRKLPDAVLIEENVRKGLVKITKVHTGSMHKKAEQEILETFTTGSYDAIAGDDQRFLRLLRPLKLNYLTTSTIILALLHYKKIKKTDALAFLERLRSYINDEQYLSTKRIIEQEYK